MAIGLAYLLRIRLPTNFNRPYISASPVEFWRRWHITLSHWLRDYLYIPLGGNRLGQARQVANLMITMVLGGLWHGANWSFLIWGFIHGVGLTASHLLKGPMRRAGVVVPHWLAVLLTFHFVTIAWIFFRAPDLTIVHQVLTGPFTAPWGNVADFASRNMFALLLLAIFFATHRYDRHARLRLMLRSANMGVVSAVTICMWILAITLRQGSSSKFIYFDF
jgi:alginate O-acetyltransferase complex protein AlgI